MDCKRCECNYCNHRFDECNGCDECCDYEHQHSSGCIEFLEEVEPLEFINNFRGDSEEIRSKFRNGYCYYFAKMLQMTYSRGEVFWTAPFGHFVWVDSTDDKAYDIEGLYEMKDHDAYYLIPEEKLGIYINDFMPNRKGCIPAEKADLIKIVKDYCESRHIEYHSEIEKYFKD